MGIWDEMIYEVGNTTDMKLLIQAILLQCYENMKGSVEP